MATEIKTKEIAERIKLLRTENGESQKDLACALNCQPNNISKLEQGNSMTIDNLILVAEHYNVSLDYLCTGKVGINLLDTLRKYIHYRLEIGNNFSIDNKSHLIPHIDINQSLYRCLRKISLAQKTKDMPQEIKEAWIETAINEFNDNKTSDTHNEYISFIPLNTEVLEKAPVILTHIEQYIV